MRKVTASAVILTALAGCSQSNSVPSSQWTFEVPPNELGGTPQADADSRDRSRLPLQLSKDAQPFVNSALDGSIANRSAGVSTGDMMGPAFGQPSEGGNGSVVRQPFEGQARGGLSALSSDPTGLMSPTARTRPDPVAQQVESYLRASGSPRALANRPYMPSGATTSLYGSSYSPEVYRSSVALPAPLSLQSSFPSADSPAAGSPANSLTASAVQPVSSALPGAVAESNAFSSGVTFGDPQPAYGVLAPGASPSVGSGSDILPGPVIASASSPEFETAELDASAPGANGTADGLPQLLPAASDMLLTSAAIPADAIQSVTQSPTSSPTADAAGFEEDVPLGTLILRDLQRSSGQTVSAPDSAVSAPIEDVVVRPENAPHLETANLENEAALSIAQSTEHRPTIESLTEALPNREGSAIVDGVENLQPLPPADFELQSPIAEPAPVNTAVSLVQGVLSPIAPSLSIEDLQTSNPSRLNSLELIRQQGFYGEISSIEWGDALPRKASTREAEVNVGSSPEAGLKSSSQITQKLSNQRSIKRRQIIVW